MLARKSYRCEQLIDWDEEKRSKMREIVPVAKYGPASEAVRHSMPEKQICAMFCGGKNCKYENAVWNESEMEINGLYSNWITEGILAMARPNTINVKKFRIIEQFKENEIHSIINLQQPGEHASCGYGLQPGGFSYDQEEFMKNDIFFYNFGWKDYGVGSLGNILDMVKVMQFALSEGKVAVHCHAGLGRTGVLIACYLVYANRMNPSEVIHYIRSRRPPSIQTTNQILCIQGFADYLRNFWMIFSPNNKPGSAMLELTLADFLFRQKNILHGEEAKQLKYVPKIIYKCCQRLISLAGCADRCDDLILSTHYSHFTDNRYIPPTPRPQKTVSLESFTSVSTLMKKSKSSFGSSNASLSGSSSQLYASEEQDEICDEVLTPAVVAQAMALTEYGSKTIDKAEELKDAINDDPNGYDRLAQITNPKIVAKLMWDWLDLLKQPVLTAQDLPSMLEYCNDPIAGLKLIDKCARHTIEMLFRTVAIFEPLDENLEQRVVQRILSVLTHQNMAVEMDSLFNSDESLLKRTSNDTGVMRSIVATKLMYFFAHLLAVMQREFKQ